MLTDLPLVSLNKWQESNGGVYTDDVKLGMKETENDMDLTVQRHCKLIWVWISHFVKSDAICNESVNQRRECGLAVLRT
jgi:hypothetical protein